jgi:RNA polymerase sigma-70 factor (ECF subfamily)
MDWFHEFRTDENQALKDIYRLYRKDCILFARRKYGLNEEDAIDVFQQSVLILYHNTATGKFTQLTSGVKSYLLGIIRLKSLEITRTSSRTIYPEDLNATLAAIPDSPLEEESSMVTLLKSLLPRLGASCRQLLELYYYRDLSINQIAEGSDYSGPDSVKTQKYKCIKRLQSMMLEHISTKGFEN